MFNITFNQIYYSTTLNIFELQKFELTVERARIQEIAPC